MSFPTLRTDRLLLREILDEDLPHIFEGLSHPEVIRYYGVRYETLEAAKTQMTWFSDLVKNGTGIWWAICSSDNSTFYGAIGFNNLNTGDLHAEVGFWLLPAYWGNRFIPEALPKVCSFGFTEMGLMQIIGIVETENLNSRKTLERSGFTYKTTDKDGELKNGQLISLDVFVLDREAWNRR